MLLNVRKIINAPGEGQEFRFEMDLSDVESGGRYPVCRPVVVNGDVRNIAGMLLLRFEAGTVLSLACDRCLRAFSREKAVRCEYMLSEDAGDGENDNIVILENDTVDLSDLAKTAFILDLDTKNLCREDCKGLCPRCGADLNQGSCGCQRRDADPRLAVLAKLLEEK